MSTNKVLVQTCNLQNLSPCTKQVSTFHPLTSVTTPCRQAVAAVNHLQWITYCDNSNHFSAHIPLCDFTR